MLTGTWTSPDGAGLTTTVVVSATPPVLAIDLAVPAATPVTSAV